MQMAKDYTPRFQPGTVLDFPGYKFGDSAKGETKKDLANIIHESLHACVWDLGEDCVQETSETIAKLLWRLGWRKEDQ